MAKYKLLTKSAGSVRARRAPGERMPLVSPTGGAKRTQLMSLRATPPSLLSPWPVMVSDWIRVSPGGDYLHFYRYIRSVTSSQPTITLLPLLGPLLERLFPQQRFLSLLCQSTAAHHYPQLRKEVWLHVEGHQGVRLWWWRIHRLPYGLGKDSFDSSSVRMLYFLGGNKKNKNV